MTATAAPTATVPYAELAATVRGDLISGGPGYDLGPAVYNAIIDKRRPPSPAAATPPRRRCARFARVRTASRLLYAAAVTTRAAWPWRTTPWSSTCRCCAAPRSAPQDHTVRVDAGCTWGDVDHATVAFGMATPSWLPGFAHFTA